jgi:CRP/FNR family transcriptional regulator
MSDTVSTLKQIAFLSDLDDSTLDRIRLSLHQRRFSAGQAVFLEGEPCQGVYLIQKGLIRTRRMSLEGREQVLSYRGPGEALNLVSAVDGGLNSASADAVTDATVYIIPCRRFRDLLRLHQELASAALKQLCNEVRLLSDLVESLALHPVRARLARFLLQQTDQQNPDRNWTQQAIATHIGSVREMVGRTMRAFASEGLVRRERERIVVLDRERLRAEAFLDV